MKILTYLISILIVLIGGGSVGSLNSSKEQYLNLIQPIFSPPSWIFPIVWTILYVLMAISIAYIINKGNSKNSLKLYSIQLFMNFAWSFIFFYFEQRFFALVWIIILVFIVYCMIKEFSKISLRIALLQLPYLFWLLFATYLNAAIWYLNK